MVYNKFGLLVLGYFGLPKSWGYFDWSAMQIYKHFYPKNKFQEVMKKYKNVLHTGMQGYYRVGGMRVYLQILMATLIFNDTWYPEQVSKRIFWF